VKRRWILAMLTVLATLATLTLHPVSMTVADGPPPGLKMQAEAAFDGYFKYGEWLPVRVHLENSGPDLDAEVQVRVTGGWGAVTFAAPAPLPTGSRKRIPLYVLPNNFSHELEVQLVRDGRVLAARTITVHPQPNINYLIGVVAPRRGALSLLTGVSLPGAERPKEVIDLTPAELPERAEGLRSFDCLILNDVDSSTLTPAQGTALVTWVHQGGRLVIGGGMGAMRTVAGLPDELLPLLPQGTTEVESLPGLVEFAGGEDIRVPGPFLVATGAEGEGRTLVAQDGLPLVRERAIGHGYVDFVALDLTTSPFDAWPGTTAFWERLLSPSAIYPQWLPPDMSPRQMMADSMVYALSNLPALDLPSVRGLGLLLLLYIVLIGPVNYLLLRRWRRLHWAWVTIPLLTVAFSAGTFGLGYTLRGTDVILNKIAVIELQEDGTANVSSFLGLFSPTRRAYEIEVEHEWEHEGHERGGLLSPLRAQYNPWGPGGVGQAGEMVFLQGEPSRVRGLTVNQWSMQTFMVEEVQSDWGRVVGDLRLDGDKLVGTVRNETGHTLQDAVLVLGGYFTRLGDMAPQAEAGVTLRLSGLNRMEARPPLSFRLFKEELAHPGPAGPSREAMLKQRILDAVFQEGRFGPMWSSRIFVGRGLGRPLPMLLAWLDEAPPQVRVAGRAPAQQTTALLYTHLSYRLPASGEIALPPGLIPGMLVETPREGGPCGPEGTSVYLGRGQAVFEFQLPEDAQDMQVDTLRLTLGSYEGWGQPPEVALYDWHEKAWTVLGDPIMGINVIADAAPLVSDDGLVRVRLSSDGARGDCLYVELGLEGTR